MNLTEAALLIGLIAEAIVILVTIIKLVAWVSGESATTRQRLLTLEHQVDNDITGRRVVAEMREDIATIKANISDLKDHWSLIEQKIIK